MSTHDNPFTPRFEELPSTLPIFPLSRAVLLPRQELPLNIFEPRYVEMVLDALGEGRNIGMIQPRSDKAVEDPVPVFRVGCAGRITTFQESGDGRLLIQLTGVCRFQIAREIVSGKAYRIVEADWSRFAGDLDSYADAPVEFDDLEGRLKQYATAHQLQVRWVALKALPAAELINFLAIQLPFDLAEKQALVEAKDLTDRAAVLLKTLEMGARSLTDSPSTLH